MMYTVYNKQTEHNSKLLHYFHCAILYNMQNLILFNPVIVQMNNATLTWQLVTWKVSALRIVVNIFFERKIY